MAYTNQFLFSVKHAQLIAIEWSGDVQYSDDTTHFKVVAVVEAEGQESQSDQLCITFWDKRAEIVFGFPDGTYIDADCKAVTRHVTGKDGVQRPITEIMAYYVAESGTKMATQNQQRERPATQNQQRENAPQNNVRAGGNERQRGKSQNSGKSTENGAKYSPRSR